MIDKYLNKIICGDCYELIKELPDKSIDLIVTDPPTNLKQRAVRKIVLAKHLQIAIAN